MRRQLMTSSCICVGATAAMLIGGEAAATFVGLSVQSTTAGTRSIYRVLAVFNDPGDRVIIWGTGDPADAEILLSNASAGTTVIQNLAADGVSPGGGFLNAMPNGSNSLPATSGPSPLDSYYTIGTDVQDYPPAPLPWLLNIGMPSLGNAASPGPPNIVQISASGQLLSYVMTPEGVVNPASNAGSLHDGDPDAVLLAQFAVAAGEHVRGTLGVVWRPAGAATGFEVASNLAFTTVPGPATLALLLAAVAMTRRVRRR